MILKRLILKISLVLLIASTAGCKKEFLETKIDLAQTQDILNTNFSTLIQFANAPYVYLRNDFSIIDNNLFAPASDEAVQTSPSANVRLFNNGSLNPFNNPDSYYGGYYQGIRAANYFLENAIDYKTILAKNRDTTSPTGRLTYKDDTLNMGWYRGEAHALRAYFYLELVKRYGGVPLVKKTFTINDNTDVPRASFDEVINFIVSEVDGFKDSMQVNWKTSPYQNNDGRLTRGAALAIKARALLLAASPLHNPAGDLVKWQKAAAAFNDVIVLARGAGAYTLDASYANYFLQNNTINSNETIWAIRYAAGNAIERSNYPIATPGGNSGITPTENLVSAFENKGVPDPTNPFINRDPRLAFNVVTNGSTWNGRLIDQSPTGTDKMSNLNASRTGYYLKKFLNDGLNLVQNTTRVHHWPVIRYAEVLLSFAEAMNEAYGPDNNNGYVFNARQAINAVRARPDVGMPVVVAADKNAFRLALKREKQVELAFENHRFWDLLRWKDAENLLNQPMRGLQITKNTAGRFVYAVANIENRVFNASRMYFYPIPQSEINKSNSILKQNPGW